MRYVFFLCIGFIIGSCASTSPETQSIAKNTLDYSSTPKQGVNLDHIQFLEQRVGELENLLKTKDEEIIALKQIYQSNQKTEESQKQEKIIIQSLNKELEQEFHLKKQDLPFQIGKNKQDEDLKLNNSSSNNDLKSNVLEKNIKLIAVQKIKPSLFYNSPKNPIRTKNIAVAKQKYKRNYRLYSQGKYDQAIQEFSKFIIFYPNATESDNAVFWIAMSYLKKQKNNKAQQYFAYLLQNYDFLATNKGGKTADALLMLGRIQEKQNLKYSKQYYHLVIRYYPDSQSARKAKNFLKSLN